jgi:adenylate cyclase class IV
MKNITKTKESLPDAYIAEIRSFITSIDAARKSLESMNALFKGEYAFTDYIYQKNTPIDLNREFIRLRAYQQTNWVQKKFVLVHKLKEIEGQSGKTLLHNEFDTLTQAQKALLDHTLLFSFFRNGYEYSLANMRIFIENIEGLSPTIEIVASLKDSIIDLFYALPIEKSITDSVPRLIEIALINKMKVEK